MYLLPSLLLGFLTITAPRSSQAAESEFENATAVPTIPTVKVRNGSYYGTHVASFDQDLFLGIPFAEPPIGEGRFANPVSLSRTWSGSLPATAYGFLCVGYGYDQIGYQESEDCLYLNVVRPSGYENQSLPVAVWIHGGGFYMGGAPDRRYNLSFIVENSVNIGKPIIAASIAYRLGPFGFLNGNDVAAAGATNLGLKDQRLALHWINENIGAFGGDKERVTIWGESAGAASVGFHLTAFNGRDDKLFRAAIMESGGPVFYTNLKKSEDYEDQYQDLVEKAGCASPPTNTSSSDSESDSLACLRKVPFTVLNNVLNTTEFTTPGWSPALDGDFNVRYGSEQLADGAFVHVPIIAGANSDEGTSFSPVGIENEGDLRGVINETWPEPILSSLLDVYNGNDGNASDEYLIPSSTTLGGSLTLPASYGSLWRRSAAYSGDMYFIAARRLTCSTWAAAGLAAYCYRFNTIPAGTEFPSGVPHFVEVAFVFGSFGGEGYAVNPFDVDEGRREKYEDLSRLMSGSWVGFVHGLDTNTWKGRDGDVESWPRYGDGSRDMVFDGNVTSFVEVDDFRSEGIEVMNRNWGVVNR